MSSHALFIAWQVPMIYIMEQYICVDVDGCACMWVWALRTSRSSFTAAARCLSTYRVHLALSPEDASAKNSELKCKRWRHTFCSQFLISANKIWLSTNSIQVVDIVWHWYFVHTVCVCVNHHHWIISNEIDYLTVSYTKLMLLFVRLTLVIIVECYLLGIRETEREKRTQNKSLAINLCAAADPRNTRSESDS